MSDFGDIACMVDDIGSSLVVQRESRTGGGYLGDTVTWATHLTLNGSIQNLSGTDRIQAQKLGVQATDRLYINESLDIIVEDRVLFGGVYYQVTYVDDVVNIGAHLKIFLNQSDNYSSESN